MTTPLFSPRSLRTKVTVFTLAIFVGSIWALIAFANRILERNIAHLVGRQQAATVAFMAAELDGEMGDRLALLEKVAPHLTPAHLRDPAAAQRFLSDRYGMLSMFNGGAFLVDQTGMAIADMPVSAGRVGINYLDGEATSAALREGRTVIGRPIIGRKLQTPIFSMAAPVRSPEGRVIGALVGVTDLSRPNFLDHLVGSRYGETGYYLLEEPVGRTIITGTDKSRQLQPLPPPGQDPHIDRHLQGSTETLVSVNPLGVEVMTSAAPIRSAKWLLLAALPTAEAFAPIRELRHKLTVAAIGLTLLAGGLTWWMLQRQLSPLLSAARTLGSLAAEPRSVMPPLPITRRDEIGVLIGAFNRLLEILRLREEALQAGETRFRTLVEWSPTAVGVHRDGVMLYVNPAAVALFGARSAADLVGTRGVDRVHPDYRANSLSRNRRLSSGENTVPVTTQKFLKLDGTVFEAEVQSITINYDGAPAIYAAISDITARQQAELALRTSETRQSKMLANIGDVIVIIDTAGINRYKSANVEKLFGWRPEELVGRSAIENIHPDDLDSAHRFLTALLEKPAATDLIECRYRHKNGQYRWVELTAINLVGDPDIRGILGNYQDITARKEADGALRSSLREKEALLKEVHHRVKNNLQVIMSLLRMEGRRSIQPDTKSVLGEMQSRIRSMALLHESLYRSGTFAAVDLAAYLNQLVTQSFRSFQTAPNAVRLALLLEPVHVEMDQALPCGLLVNELVSNALKHAFPGGRPGLVCVNLQPVAGEPGRWCLAVTDDGVGLPADLDLRRSQSLGLQLVADLAGQLRGELAYAPAPGSGTRVAITFTIGEQPTSAHPRA